MRVARTAVLAVLGLVAANSVVGAAEPRATKEKEAVKAIESESKAVAIREAAPTAVRQPTERMLKEKQELDEGYENLRQQFRDANGGRDFTTDELREAIERAHAEAGTRGEADFPTNRHLFVQGVPESERRRHLAEHADREAYKESRRMQTIRKADGFIVSGASPGFSWNAGRNTFYCAAVPHVDRNQRNTRRRQKMTLKNCYTSPADEIITKYTDDQELWMKRIDTVYFDWCLESKKIRRNKAIQLNYCDVYDETQVFELLGNDDSWRPTADTTLCVTCQNHNCASGGGKLRYKSCSSDLSGNNKYRGGQAFIFCFLGTSCAVDNEFNRIDCRIEERCGSKSS